MIQQGIDLLKEISTEKKIGIHFEASPSIPPIYCHQQLISRSIENILNNALKYTPEGGKVDITVTSYLEWKDVGIVEISIKDTGIGISEEDIERIFEPFFRGRNASKEMGTGLGLSFVKEVVELHGGKILVQSEPKKGSVFSILLPIQVKFK
jgi:signal transduction histidine kinase